ncbi:K(+)-transporting ATPase subunit F [Amycolatopsis antarctica]|uniref:K(+)-transporting ATPase subunit F n=1 Tax=Amycolatopsis antarctica TaxID=1854586 RepID=A0A263D6R8_9PSEU|nr:K(+)-transporting ATPase subunit F [Amycolatopsis antarctica]
MGHPSGRVGSADGRCAPANPGVVVALVMISPRQEKYSGSYTLLNAPAGPVVPRIRSSQPTISSCPAPQGIKKTSRNARAASKTRQAYSPASGHRRRLALDAVPTWGTANQRCGDRRGRHRVRSAVDRRVRRARADAARDGETVSGADVAAEVVSAVLALGLVVYLLVALIRPEKF